MDKPSVGPSGRKIVYDEDGKPYAPLFHHLLTY